MSLIAVRDVSVSYGSAPVLQNISFEVERGDYIGIAGPNGSGKSTLIKTLLGLLTPVNGSVELFGEPLEHFNTWGRIGYLPQRLEGTRHAFPATVEEIVTTGLLAGKTFPKRLDSTDRRAVETILGQLEIIPLRKHFIGKLSGGQLQRVLLARALVHKPDVLILDEPTVALDPATRDTFYEILREMNKTRAVTILLVTHDTPTIGEFATKLIYLDRQLIFFGTFGEFCESANMTEYFGAQAQHVICHRHPGE